MCRFEFQQDESAYMTKKGRGCLATAPGPLKSASGLHVRVTGGQHGHKPGVLHLAPTARTGFLIVPVVAHFFENPFAINLLL